MEVFFKKFYRSGVSRLGGYNLPGRLIKTDFGHFGTKSVAGVRPTNARRKVFLGDAFPLPLSLIRLLPLPFRTYGPLRSD